MEKRIDGLLHQHKKYPIVFQVDCRHLTSANDRYLWLWFEMSHSKSLLYPHHVINNYCIIVRARTNYVYINNIDLPRVPFESHIKNKMALKAVVGQSKFAMFLLKLCLIMKNCIKVQPRKCGTLFQHNLILIFCGKV